MYSAKWKKKECEKFFKNINKKNSYNIYTFTEISQLIHLEISKLHYYNRKHKTRFTNKNKNKYNKKKKINIKENYNSKILINNDDNKFIKKKYLNKKKFNLKNKNALMNINNIKDININIFNNKTILINNIYKLIKLKKIKKLIKKATYNCKRIII